MKNYWLVRATSDVTVADSRSSFFFQLRNWCLDHGYEVRNCQTSTCWGFSFETKMPTRILRRMCAEIYGAPSDC